MNMQESELRENLATELADIFYRQQLIVDCNESLGLTNAKDDAEKFAAFAEEDEKSLQMVESVINSFGVRVGPKEGSVRISKTLSKMVTDSELLPLERLSAYLLLKQNQMMCCHLIHKSAQVSLPDIKLALTPFAGVYATVSKHVAELGTLTENYGIQFLTGKEPATGLVGRARDAMATVAGAVLSKAGKPLEEMNVMTVLKMEHRKVDMLHAEIKATAEFERAIQLFHQMKADLTSHSIAEEQTVYAQFLRLPDMQEKMEHAEDEHIELRQRLDEVSEAEGDQDLFMQKLDELMDCVKHHVKEEESEIFKLIKKNSTEDEQIALSAAFAAAKRNIQLNIGTDPVIASAGDLDTTSV